MTFSNSLFGSNNFMTKFVEGIFEKNIIKINDNLNDYLVIFGSFNILKHSDTGENTYQVLIKQLFTFYNINNFFNIDEDSFFGRYDISFPNKYKKNEYILIEVKVYRTDEDKNDENNKDEKKKDKMNDNEIEKCLHKECVYAIKQIDNNINESKDEKYKHSSFIKYGIAFYDNKCRVEMKINNEKIQSPSKYNDEDDGYDEDNEDDEDDEDNEDDDNNDNYNDNDDNKRKKKKNYKRKLRNNERKWSNNRIKRRRK